MRAEANSTKTIFLAALDRPPADRTAYLNEACAGNAALRREVEALLAAHNRPDQLLDQPAATHLDPADEPGGLGFLDPTTRPNAIGRLGHYEVLEVVGRGGMGIVFRAFDEKLHRVVAIKALAPALAHTGEARQRFVREARAAAAISHEHVIAIYAVEDAGPVPYLVMQFVAGKTLQDKIDRGGPFSLPEVLRIGFQIAEGLAAAHKQGLIHRDVKPANILLENGVERVRITDFGLARADDDASLTESGMIVGTPQYMSPEQAQSLPLDPRSDLFSLGSVLYAMCAGQIPFRAGTPLAVLRRVCDETPRPLRAVNPAIPEWLEIVVAKLQAKKPADRFKSAAEVAKVLSRRLAELQSGTEPPDTALTTAPIRRNRPLRQRLFVRWAGLILLLAAAVGATWVVANQWRKGSERPPDANPSTPPVANEPAAPIVAVALKPARTLTQHTGEVLAVAFSPNGKVLASGGKDRKALLWDAETWQVRGTLADHSGDVVAFAFSPDSSRLASVTSAGDAVAVRLWDVATAKAAGTLGEPVAGMWGVAWSSDGSRVACAGFDRTLRIFDVPSGELKLSVPDVCTGLVRGLDFSNNGNRIVTGGAGPTRLWDASTGRETPSDFPGDMCPSFLSGSDTTVVGWVYRAGRVAICDSPSGRVRATWRAHPGLIAGLATSADGRFLVSLGQEGVAYVWSMGDQSEIASLKGHEGTVHSASFSPDGSRLATAGKDGTIRLWDLPAVCHVRK